MEPTWSIDDEARNSADSVYYDELRPIDISKFAQGLLIEPAKPPILPARELREIYADSLFDLHRLLEEVRFEVALAVVLLVDFRVRRDRGEVEIPKPPPMEVSLSAEVLAALAPHAIPPPSPSVLLDHLHRRIGSNRYLSRWVAAQWLDGAVLRALSCMDRVVTMLHLRAGLPIHKRKDDTLRLPSFNRDELRSLREPYQSHTKWADFRAIADHPIYELIKRYRDGTMHYRRWPSELHGETRLSYWDAGAPATDRPAPEQTYEGLTAQQHVRLLIVTWEEVIRSTVEMGGDLLLPE
ncbi:MAG: hypothetical protein LC775_01610 [Acidobacteria bacterium]|nr:hypothetical protein [Acidobacteriota bacterium]